MSASNVEELSRLLRSCINTELDQQGTLAGRAIMAMAALELELERRRALLTRQLRQRAEVIVESEDRGTGNMASDDPLHLD